MATLSKYVNPARVAWPFVTGAVAGASGFWFGQLTGIVLFVVCAALATLGATLAWQSFSGYEKALIDADGMYPDDRLKVRSSVRINRKKLGYALLLLIAGAACGTIVGTGLKDGAFADPFLKVSLAFLGGVAAMISYLTTVTIWRLFFSLDDFRVEIRDAVRQERSRLESLAGFRKDADALSALGQDPRYEWKVSDIPH